MTARSTVTRALPLPPAEVLQRLADPDVAARRAGGVPGLAGTVVDLTSSGPGDLDLTIRASLPTDWVPRRVAAHVTGAPGVIRRERWHLTDDGRAPVDVDVTLEGVPATTLEVTGGLVPDGATGGSTLEQHLTLTVALPVVGGGIERAVLVRLREAYAQELEIIADACR